MLLSDDGKTLTFDPMLLHRRNLLQSEAQSIYDEEDFGNVDPVELAILQCKYKENK